MENNPVPTTVKQPQKEKLSQDILAVVGETVVLIILFLFSLGVLNYFHIIQLTKSFPFLAGLPQQHVEKQATTTQNNQLFSPLENSIETYITTTIQPAYVLHDMTGLVQQNILHIAPNDKYYTLSFAWTQKDAIMSFNTLNTKTQFEDIIYVQPKTQPDFPIDAAHNYTALQQIFRNVPSVTTFHCGTKNNVTKAKATVEYCQAFYQMNNEKVGYGIIKANFAPPFQYFTCRIPATSPNFDTVHSCVTVF